MSSTTTQPNITANHIPMVLINRELMILEVSQGAFSLFKQKDSFSFTNLPQMFGKPQPELMDAAKKGNSVKIQNEIICTTGQTRWINSSLFPADKVQDLFYVVFEDITAEKEEQTLADQAQKIGKIGSWKVNLISNQVVWSKITKEIHEVGEEFNPDLEQGINFYKEGYSRERILEAVSKCIENATPFDLELIIVTAKGNEKWVRAIGEAEINNGKTIGFQGVFQDIDEIKRERLRNQVLDDRMRAAVESANIGIWDWDIVKDELIWDQNMFALFGINQEEFDGAYDAWESSVHPEDKERAAYEVSLALQGKKDFDTEFRITKEDGSIAHIQGRAQVFRDAQGSPLRMVGTNADISRIKRKDERLRRLLELTEKQNKKLVNFAHIVSHNLRSNSTNISMLSGMLASNSAKGRTDEFIGMIQKSSEKLEETLNQLNEIIKIQATNKNDLIKIKVKPILLDVCESINAIIKESKAKISIDIDEEISVWGIKPYLTSIFLNLLTNSIKYRNSDNVLHIQIEAKVLENQTILSFKDNGLGIDLERHGQNLFGMYKTFHRHKDAKGIGLFISKNQMEAMDGKIEVTSKVSKGSCFFLYFKR